MNNFIELDTLLREEASDGDKTAAVEAYGYAACMARVENVVAVVSDISGGSSRIFNGGFADRLGMNGYREENSIWEKRLLALMPERERDEKFMAELRFYHYLRGVTKNRSRYYLMSKLRFADGCGGLMDVLHRMYYIYGEESARIRFAVCLYGPMTFDFKGRSVIVDSLTGTYDELTSTADSKILSRRERQVLALIDAGLRSADIAARLNISKHTVSRHRQEIISRLQVKNSIEACRLAKSMELI